MPAPRNSDATASDSDDDSETDSESSSCCDGPAHVDLTFERLQSLNMDSGTRPDDGDSAYARSGSSKKRVVEALRNPCCQCECQVPLGILMKVVTAFWVLAKTVQDSLLWGLQSEAGKKRKKWFIQGLEFMKVSCLCC
jgi:hypothetical protein